MILKLQNYSFLLQVPVLFSPKLASTVCELVYGLVQYKFTSNIRCLSFIVLVVKEKGGGKGGGLKERGGGLNKCLAPKRGCLLEMGGFNVLINYS